MKIGKTKLKLFLASISIIAVSAFLMVSNGSAASLVSSQGDGYYHSSSSGGATNDTTTWQSLGYSAGTDSYGVTWSTDGGNTWGTEDLNVGDTVQFKFVMSSANEGDHYGNVLKAWIDWSDGTAADNADFNDDSEVVASSFAKVGWYTTYYPVTVLSEEITIDSSMIGTAYLRARVTCTESLEYTNHLYSCYTISQTTYINAFNAYAGYYQGEIEEWAITVNGDTPGSVSPTPEPATFALFGIGLLGLAGISRKKLNHQS